MHNQGGEPARNILPWWVVCKLFKSLYFCSTWNIERLI
nr:MAG TPA: hypothetical protein [Caudoviricetes sp.]